MSEILNSAIVKVQNAKYAFCRFITANDTGKNGSHQAGFYIPKCAAALLFDTPGVKGENKDKMVKVKWQDDFTTDSRFIYYGQGTRNEYRITRFGKGFPFFEEDNVGDLLIIAQQIRNLLNGIGPGFQFFPWFFSGNFMVFNLIGVPFFKAGNIDSYLSGNLF